jgi:glycerol-3-phosphate dehydrogenase
VSVFDTREQRAHVLTARVVVNATGPWVETVLGGVTDTRTSAAAHAGMLNLSKGIHVVVERTRLPVRNMVMMTAADGRPVFAIARDAVTYLGTTDTPHRGGAEYWPTVEARDLDYLLATANAHFPDAALCRDDIRATWAGLRPLIHQAGKAPKALSRRDEIWRHARLITIAGGKLTGFRRMAEQAMAVVGSVLGRAVAMPRPLAPLPGGERADLDALQREIATRYQVEAVVAERLMRLYGAETFAVLGDQPTPLSASVFREELSWAVTVEGAATLEDVMYRRLRLPWYLPDECQAVLEPATLALADLLGWDDARQTAELAATRARLAAELSFPETAPSA